MINIHYIHCACIVLGSLRQEKLNFVEKSIFGNVSEVLMEFDDDYYNALSMKLSVQSGMVVDSTLKSQWGGPSFFKVSAMS